MNKQTKIIFYSLIVIFILTLISFLINLNEFAYIGMILISLFFIFGVVFLFIIKKEKKKLKPFLLLTGISAITPFLGSILHNLFYALSIIFENLKLFFEILHTGFFIIAVVVAPIAFVVGVVGVLLISKRKK